MGGSSHYRVDKKDHPGSSQAEINDEPNWGRGHNHHVGFRNRDSRKPGFVEEAQDTYQSLQDRKSRGELVNFRDILNGQENLHLMHPKHRSVGWRFVLECTEDWVKYGQQWPANQTAKKSQKAKSEAQKDNTDKSNVGQAGDFKNTTGHFKDHGDLENNNLKPEEQALLEALRAESHAAASLTTNSGNHHSPQKKNRTNINIDEADQFTPDNWIPRCTDLIRLTGHHPMDAEPPLTKLFDSGLITSNELHYVRNHGSVPRLMWESHTLSVDIGSSNPPTEFGMDELCRKFRSVNIPIFLACDGNRRKELNLMRRSKGFNWGAAAAACAYWKGTLVRDVLLEAGIQRDQFEPENGRRRWINFEGSDELTEGKYATCIPVAYVMDEGNDVLLAYEMNDLPLPPDHGYPLRLMIPGHVGGRCVKWLKRIWITDTENESYYHIWDNRVLPSFVTDMDSPFAETMFRHPSTACNEQNLNSVIVKPRQGERIYFCNTYCGEESTGSLEKNGKSRKHYRIEGFAYNGGGHEVQRVEVSLDEGSNWLYCVRRFPDMPVRHGKKFWTWCHWYVDVPIEKLAQGRSITVRCFNVFKNSQPREPAWNLMGMMNNCWYTIRSSIVFAQEKPRQEKISASDSNEVEPAGQGPYLLFRHPVEPGTGDGGWMKPSFVNQLEKTKRDAGTPQKQFTREEIEKHDQENDSWIVVDGKVYDVTSVMAWHPGGKAPIMSHAGRVHAETTEEFASIHDDFAYEKLKDCLLGVVTDKVATFIKENAKHLESLRLKDLVSSHVALKKHQWIPTKLISRKEVSKDTRSYTFQLPNHKAILGLQTCQHIQMGFHLKDKMVVRSYTPTRPLFPAPDNAPELITDGQVRNAPEQQTQHHQAGAPTDLRDGVGTFELVVKTYFPTCEQPGGLFSNILDCMPLGGEVEIRGPTGDIEYCGNGKFIIEGQKRTFKNVSLVLGGSGITPGFALMARIARSEDTGAADETPIRAVDANKSEGDILLRGEMEELEKRCSGRLAVTHVLSRPSDTWTGHRGHVDKAILRAKLFVPEKDSVVFVCGPPTLIQKTVMPVLKEWGYVENENLFGF